MYIIVNINEQCARFPGITGLTIGLINGLYDASAGIFLTFKFIYEAEAATLPQMITGFTIGTSLIWVKTFFYTPYYEVDAEKSAFGDSAVKKSLTCGKDSRTKVSLIITPNNGTLHSFEVGQIRDF